MKLSTKARYAVTALADMVKMAENKPVSLASISERQELPLPYLEQIFLKLRQSGLVNSARGAGGGYILSRPPHQVRVLDIITAVDKPLKATRCEHESPRGCQATGQRCLTHDLWDELGAVVQQFFAHITLEDIRDNRVAGRGRFALFPQIGGAP